MRRAILRCTACGLGILVLAAGAQPARAAALDRARKAWASACSDSATAALSGPALHFRLASLRAATAPRLTPRARFAAVCETDGLVAAEVARRQHAWRHNPAASGFDALADSICHHVPLDPLQRIVDYRDPRFRVEIEPFPGLDYRDACTYSLWLELQSDVGVMETKVVSHAGVADGKLTVMLQPGPVVDVVVGLDQGATLRATTRAALPIGRWFHLAIVFDRRHGLGVFVDGRPVELEPRAPAYRTGTRIRTLPGQVLYVGGLDRILPGLVDDVRLFDRALGPAEIGALFERRDVWPGLIGHWPFDDDGTTHATNRVRASAPGRIGSGVVVGEPGVTGLGGGRAYRFSRAREEWRARLGQLESAIAAAETRLLGTVPPSRAATPESILVRLRAHRAALVYYVAGVETNRLQAFVVVPDAPQPWHVVELGPLTPVTERVRRFQSALDSHTPYSPESESHVREASRDLAIRLWDPIEAVAGSHREVWLRLDPALHGIAFAALVDSAGRYLVERYAFAGAAPLRGRAGHSTQRAASGAVIAFGNPAYGAFPGIEAPPAWVPSPHGAEPRRGPGRATCLVPGRVLHGTHRELAQLRDLFALRGRTVRVLEWNAAYEHELRTVARAGSVLHLATHSYHLAPDCLPAVPRNPLTRAGLQMAGVARTRPEDSRAADDGLLSADEVARLDLESTALVAFSGCSTACGPAYAGDGPWSLPTAAWIAGAGASLATLWDVDDDAMPEQVTAFYRAWSADASPAVALQQALLETITRLRTGRGHAHPAIWAALVIEGM